MRVVGLIACTVIVGGCAMTSDVMDTGNGTYMISAHAAPIRGGATGANQVAYEAATKFCAAKGAHPVVITVGERDVYQGSFGGSSNAFGGGIFAAGNTDLHFRCENGEVGAAKSN